MLKMFRTSPHIGHRVVPDSIFELEPIDPRREYIQSSTSHAPSVHCLAQYFPIRYIDHVHLARPHKILGLSELTTTCEGTRVVQSAGVFRHIQQAGRGRPSLSLPLYEYRLHTQNCGGCIPSGQHAKYFGEGHQKATERGD